MSAGSRLAESPMKLTLVLGGGGVAGIAWETGLLKGLRDAGVDLTGADVIIGTSAGSVVGAQLANGCELDTLYAKKSGQCSAKQAARRP